MIRQATVRDIEKMYGAAREFYASSKFLGEFDGDSFRATWQAILDGGCGVIFLYFDGDTVVGSIAGVKHRDPNSPRMVASEMYWFIQDGHRGGGMELYREFERWARESGCREIRMSRLCDLMPDRMDAVYRRLGFTAAEVVYVKEVAA